MTLLEMQHIALQIATKAHEGQVRKFGGAPYIVHPIAVSGYFPPDSPLRIVGLLHDVLEDTGVTAEVLMAQGIPLDYVTAIQSVSRNDGETYSDFILRAKQHPWGRQVKCADLMDNMSSLPLDHGLLDRYRKAMLVLVG